ncbi:MAG: nuclear transport factor 2 family protein [Actinobacteria bacterium]|nr:MAG: nuclear transport factor 2 family protein [Actinomycetota bacterium]
MTPQEIADRIEIDDLITRYATAVDTKDWDLYRTVFTDDAVIDYTSAGGIRGSLGEVVEWLSHALKLFPMTQHLITNRHVVLDGDTATGRSYYYNPLGRPDDKGGMQLLFFGGYYNDRFRRTADGWRIAERVEETAWVEGSLPGAPPQN